MEQKNRHRVRFASRKKLVQDTPLESDLIGNPERVKNYLDVIAAIIVVVDKEGRTVFLNERGCQLLECTEDKVIGKNWFDVFAPDGVRGWLKQRFSELMTGGPTPHETEHPLITFGGVERLVKWNTIILTDKTGNITGALSSGEDVTEKRKAEEQLKRSERKYRGLYDTSRDGIALTDAKGNIKDVNQAFADMLKYRIEELRGKNFAQYTPRRWVEIERKMDRDRLLADGYSYEFEKEYIRKDGTLLPVSVRIWSTEDEDGKGVVLWAAVRDMTERKKMEQQLRSLSHSLVKVQEEERRHISRELHDEIGQMLTGIKISAEMASRGAPVHDQLEEIKEQVSDLIGRVRNLSLNLWPSMLEDLGLPATLQWLFNRYISQTGITVNFDYTTGEKQYTSEVQNAAYRIVQEALTNVARHAGVKQVQVKLWVDKKHLHVEVKDLGKGFDIRSLDEREIPLGITSMRERVNLLGGDFKIESKPGKGTRVSVKLPI